MKLLNGIYSEDIPENTEEVQTNKQPYVKEVFSIIGEETKGGNNFSDNLKDNDKKMLLELREKLFKEEIEKLFKELLFNDTIISYNDIQIDVSSLKIIEKMTMIDIDSIFNYILFSGNSKGSFGDLRGKCEKDLSIDNKIIFLTEAKKNIEFIELKEKVSQKFNEVIPYTTGSDERRFISHYNQLDGLEESNTKEYIKKAQEFLDLMNGFINSSKGFEKEKIPKESILNKIVLLIDSILLFLTKDEEFSIKNYFKKTKN